MLIQRTRNVSNYLSAVCSHGMNLGLSSQIGLIILERPNHNPLSILQHCTVMSWISFNGLFACRSERLDHLRRLFGAWSDLPTRYILEHLLEFARLWDHTLRQTLNIVWLVPLNVKFFVPIKRFDAIWNHLRLLELSIFNHVRTESIDKTFVSFNRLFLDTDLILGILIEIKGCKSRTFIHHWLVSVMDSTLTIVVFQTAILNFLV